MQGLYIRCNFCRWKAILFDEGRAVAWICQDCMALKALKDEK